MPDSDKVKPVWFLPRTRDRPIISAITLGNIIESPWDPEEALNRQPPPAIPQELYLPRPDETSWSWTQTHKRTVGVGLFASFLQILGLGGDVDHTKEKSHTDTYNAERLLTVEFKPDKPYLELAVKDDGVQEALVGPQRRPKVYIVTGLKLAYGATKVTEAMAKRGIHAQIGVDLSAGGVPLTVGPKMQYSNEVEEKLSADKSDFVFGIRLRALTYKKGQVADQRFDRGAKYGLDSREDKDGEYDYVVDPTGLELEDMEEDVSSEYFEMQSKDVVETDDTEEEIRYFYPEPDSED